MLPDLFLHRLLHPPSSPSAWTWLKCRVGQDLGLLSHFEVKTSSCYVSLSSSLIFPSFSLLWLVVSPFLSLSSPVTAARRETPGKEERQTDRHWVSLKLPINSPGNVSLVLLLQRVSLVLLLQRISLPLLLQTAAFSSLFSFLSPSSWSSCSLSSRTGLHHLNISTDYIGFPGLSIHCRRYWKCIRPTDLETSSSDQYVFLEEGSKSQL